MGESIKNSADPSQYSPLALAYLGDAVYELIVRERVLADGNRQVNKLHKESTKYVNAAAQAELAEAIQDRLTDEEKAVYKRGRNTKVHGIPKNAEISEYHAATGLEALFGWLWLMGRTDRINELFELIMEES